MPNNALSDEFVQNSESLTAFFSWLFTNHTDDDYFDALWKKLILMLPLKFLFIEFKDSYSENSYSLSFGKISQSQQSVIDQFLKQTNFKKERFSSKKPFHITQGTHNPDILAYVENSLDVSTTLFVTSDGSDLSNHHENIIQLVFSAIVMKNQKIAFRQAEQELSLIRDERRTQYNFISRITHDLRNPLGCIKGYVTTLLRTDVEWAPEIQHQFLEVINTESDHLEDMISNLLETARLQSGQYELNYQNINLQTLLLEIQKTNKIKYPELTIHIDVISPEPFVLADQKKLTQAFQNLVDNATKHAKIFEIWFKIEKENGGFTIHYEDHGEGIAEDRLKNIFERFSRTPEFSPGSHGVGLGLHISKQIIERHLGSIQVNSLPGTGTTFSIKLPKAPTQKLGKERG